MKDNDEKLEAKIIEKNEQNINETVNENIEKTEKKPEVKEEKIEAQYQFKKRKKEKKKNIIIPIVLVLITILIIFAVFSTAFALINANNNTILSGISVGNVLTEGLTEEQAKKIINEKYEQEKIREILLKVNGETFSITPEQIQVNYNVDKAVESAYKIGRSGNIFQNNFEIIRTIIGEKNIDVELTYNEKLLDDIIRDLNAKVPNTMVDNTYCIEDGNLIITRGVAGIVIDDELAKQAILNAIKTESREEVELTTKYVECPEIDIEKIYSEVKTEPQNATYTTNPFQLIPHKNGTDFDLEAAKELLKEEKEEYVIELIVKEPEIKTNELGEEAFPDLLSTFSTKYDETNIPRTKNLKLAMAKLDGVVVMPGEVFSYNKTLGKRTVEDGYQYANGFAGGKVVPMLAGGICQISSTLYDAVLYANLNIVERYNHMFQATYVEPGKDATVVYGSLDFKFENTRNYPIMIKAKANAGLAEVKIYGIKEEVEYEIEVITTVLNYTPYKVKYEDDSSLKPGQEKVSQYGLQGCKSITHRIVKLNGQEISKEVLSTDTYSPLDKIIKRGPKKQTEQTSTVPEKSETSSNKTENNEIATEKVEQEKNETINQETNQTNSETTSSNTVETNTTETNKPGTQVENEVNKQEKNETTESKQESNLIEQNVNNT